MKSPIRHIDIFISPARRVTGFCHNVFQGVALTSYAKGGEIAFYSFNKSCCFAAYCYECCL